MLSIPPLVLTLLSASALPLLAVLGILLRKDLLQGKMKIAILIAGIILLAYTVTEAFIDHGEELGISDIAVAGATAAITIFILSRFSSTHRHDAEEGGARGIVLSEAFHSVIDGAVIGATYLVNPLLGGAATIGIVMHELPKIIGTLALFRGLGLSTARSVIYGFLSQIGSPISAVFILLAGKQISAEQFHALEIASISSLGAIIVWIIWLEIRYHKHTRHSH